MILHMGTTISTKRQEMKITQQELADFIGVTKASVSKWENHQSYPDITLLPLLASFFDMSIDELLNYHAKLTTEEIQNIYGSLQSKLQKDNGEEVLKSLRSLIKRYYASYPFVLQMGLFILNHFDFFPGESREQKLSVYLSEAQGLFKHVVENAKEAKLVEDALKLEAYTLLLLGEPDEVLVRLGNFSPTNLPVEPLIASAFQQKGEMDQAIGVMQSAIYQQLSVMMSFLTNYSQFLLRNPLKFQQTIEIGTQLSAIFNLKQLQPIIWLNFQTAAVHGFATLKLEQPLTNHLTETIEALEQMTFPIYLHGDDYFDQVQEWIDQLDLGNLMPRGTFQMKGDCLAFLLNDPSLTDYWQSISFQEFYTRLQVMKESKEYE